MVNKSLFTINLLTIELKLYYYILVTLCVIVYLKLWVELSDRRFFCGKRFYGNSLTCRLTIQCILLVLLHADIYMISKRGNFQNLKS